MGARSNEALAIPAKARLMAGVMVIAALLAMTGGVYTLAYAQRPTGQAFDFAALGDTGYAADQEPWVENLLAEVYANRLEFVVHVGDFGGPSAGSCTDEHRDRRLSQFGASAHPLIYTPGDNDWTDCWEERAGAYDALERLATLRERFFAGERSLGQRSIPLVRQSTQAEYRGFRENARWSQAGVVFLTVHYVSEVLGRSEETDAEFAERDAANRAWLRDGFQEARAAAARGMVVFTQANPSPNFAGGRGVRPEPRPGFDDFWNLLEDEAIAFGKPILLIHGDTHYFRVDHPLHSSAPECGAGTHDVRPAYCRIHNLTRVEVFGAPYHHWVRVTVDPNDPNLFTVRPQFVEANLSTRP